MYSIGKESISNLSAIKFDGTYRVLGCISETAESKKKFQKFGSNFAAPLDQTQWKESDSEWYNLPIWNQLQTGSCVAQSCGMGVQFCRAQEGKPFIDLSPWYLYGLINNGVDKGAMISDALNALMQYGICPQADLSPGVMYKNQFPQKAFDDAVNYKLQQAYHCDTFEEICSAITLGFMCPLGIYVDQNFANLNSDGIAPIPRAMNGGGHALLGIGLKKYNGSWIIKVRNSWGNKFGLNGCCYLTKSHFQIMATDAFAIQSILDNSTDNNPPVVKE